jgi:hypothetical protein
MANADWAIEQQTENGWFLHNDFTVGNDSATLHTIAYATRGLLEIGAATGCGSYVDFARRTAATLLSAFQQSGEMAGRYQSDWSAPVTWRCVPGEAQLALPHNSSARRARRCTAASADHFRSTARMNATVSSTGGPNFSWMLSC